MFILHVSLVSLSLSLSLSLSKRRFNHLRSAAWVFHPSCLLRPIDFDPDAAFVERSTPVLETGPPLQFVIPRVVVYLFHVSSQRRPMNFVFCEFRLFSLFVRIDILSTPFYGVVQHVVCRAG
eukprot:GHVU01221127.1.p2 GENE.GHVU01221127.1~~GHVU01221127.1.p2  ORF type:complete len:122 (-),score=1.50 GHVU01221127.1:153-518(-)